MTVTENNVAAQAGDEPMRANAETECRKSCNICFDENGNKWPCTKALAKRLAAIATTKPGA